VNFAGISRGVSVQSGSFEREVAAWLRKLVDWIHSHERFTWINLLMAISPMPLVAASGVVLAALQLTMCNQGKIPKTERRLLVISLLLGVINSTFAALLILYIAQTTWSYWHLWNPFWWMEWLFGRLTVGRTVSI
jgi:hypothetical protein